MFETTNQGKLSKFKLPFGDYPPMPIDIATWCHLVSLGATISSKGTQLEDPVTRHDASSGRWAPATHRRGLLGYDWVMLLSFTLEPSSDLVILRRLWSLPLDTIGAKKM